MNRRVVVGGVLALGLAGWWFFTRGDSAVSARSSADVEQPSRVSSAASPGRQSAVQVGEAVFAVRVVADGKPVRGARVRASRPGHPAPAWDKSPEVKTDADGRADVPAEPGEWVLTALHEGWATRLLDVTKPRGELRTAVTLELESGVELRGRAVDEDGQPVVPATIRAVPLGERMPRRRSAPEGVVEVPVDAKGEFVLDHLAAGWWILDGVAEGSGKAAPQRLLLPTPERLALTFRRSGFLDGAVALPDGGVAPGAQVTLIGPEGTESLAAGPTGTFSAELQPGSYRVRAKLGPHVGSAHELVLIRGGQTRTTKVVLEGFGGALHGTVTAADAPVENALVVVSPHNEDGNLATTLSDREGRWRIEGLPPATYDVEVLTRRWQPGEYRGLSVTEGADVEVDAQLEALGGLRGVVVDEADRPVAARVWLRMSARQEHRQVQTGPDGRFEFLDVRPARGSVTAARTDDEQGPGTTLTIKPGVVAEVKLVTHDTQRVEVKLDRSGCARARDVSLWIAERASGTRARTWTVPAAKASLELQLSSGEWTVMPWIDARARCESRAAKVKVAKGTPTPPVQLTFGPPDDAADFVVTVLEADGQPSNQASVTVRDVRGSLFASSTEADGTVRFRPMDKMNIVARNLGRAAHAENVPATQRTLTLTLAPPARLQLHLEGASGITHVKVAQAGGLGEDEFRVSSTDVLLEDQPAGSLEVTATDATRSRLGKAQVTTRPGATTSASVRLEPAALLRGRVVLPAGATTPSFIELARSGASEDVLIEPDGSFAFPPLQPGAWELAVYCGPPCEKGFRQAVTLPAGPTELALP